LIKARNTNVIGVGCRTKGIGLHVVDVSICCKDWGLVAELECEFQSHQ